MKKIFSIEYPDDFGPEWLDKENLQSCLFSKKHIGASAELCVKIEELPMKKKNKFFRLLAQAWRNKG